MYKTKFLSRLKFSCCHCGQWDNARNDIITLVVDDDKGDYVIVHDECVDKYTENMKEYTLYRPIPLESAEEELMDG